MRMNAGMGFGSHGAGRAPSKSEPTAARATQLDNRRAVTGRGKNAEELERLRKEKSQWDQSSHGTQIVTSASRVTNGGVGKERTRTGEDKDREGPREVRDVSRADQAAARPSLPEELEWLPPPPKERPAEL